MSHPNRRPNKPNNYLQPKSEPSSTPTNSASPVLNGNSPNMGMTDTAPPNIPTTDTAPPNIGMTPLPPPILNPEASPSGSEKRSNTRSASKSNKLAAAQETPDPLALTPALENKALQFSQMYAQIGMLMMGFNPAAGKILYITALDRAREVIRVARHHKSMMKIVDNMINGNDYVAMAGGHFMMLGGILAVSGRLPENNMTMMLRFQGQQAVSQFDQMMLAAQAMQQGQENGHIPDATPVTGNVH